MRVAPQFQQAPNCGSTVSPQPGHTQAGPDGGVRIRVGTVFYDSPNDVPDARLRELLKLSIAEWERQS